MERDPSMDKTMDLKLTPPSDESRTPAVGRRVGQFELLGELGRGGMGIVYLALDESLKRKVALKVLRQEQAEDERAVKRFLREAETAAKLRHPHIISIYLAGECDGTWYFSMEYVPGITLAELIRGLRSQMLRDRGPLSVRRIMEHGEPVARLIHGSSTATTNNNISAQEEQGERILSLSQRNYVREALGLFAGIAEALQYAHERGVVHRDIKPSNLILAPSGRLMLADFGLAKIADGASITRAGDLMGSPAYMSPEQASSRKLVQDHRSDIWSLGVTLYELLTLAHPFEADTLEVTLHQILTKEPTPMRSVNPRLPKDVETIVMKMIEKNPDDRYQSIGDVAEELRCVLNYESIQARSRGAFTRGFRFAQRHRSPLAIGLLATALLTGGLWAHQEFQARDRTDIAHHFSSVSRELGQQRGSLLETRDVEAIQRHLLSSMDADIDLITAIDRYGMRTSEKVAGELEQTRAPSLRPAMRSLAMVHAIYRHHPDGRSDEHIETFARATAEHRNDLVDEIRARLAGSKTRDASVPAEWRDSRTVLWNWLCTFLGTRDLIPGVRESIPLVRINALHAMLSLPEYQYQLGSELMRVVSEPGLDPLLRQEVLMALPDLAGVGDSPGMLAQLGELVRNETLPFRSRLQVLKILSASGRSAAYRDVFEHMLADPESRVRELAEESLDQI